MAHMKKVLVPDKNRAGYGGDLEGDHEGHGDRVREDHGRRGARSVRVIQESCTSQIEGE